MNSCDTTAKTRDAFDFLRSEEFGAAPKKKESIAVNDCDAPNLVAVTVESPDGRKLRREIPASRWQEEAYRIALVRNMRLLVA